MKKIETLKKNYEFKIVLTKGVFYYGKQVQAVIYRNVKAVNRIGIAVSVKSGKATKRNYVKRLIRENYAFYKNQMILGYDIVFLWNKKQPIESANYRQIKQDIFQILKKANLLKS